jgi:hypothetical protein
MAISQIVTNSIATGAVSAADLADGSVGAAKLATTGSASSSTYLRGDMAWSSLPASGKLLQLVSNTTTDQAAYSLSNTFEQANMMNTSITPSSASSKVLVTVSVMFGEAGSTAYPAFRLTKDGSEITAARGVVNASRKLLTGSAGSAGGAGSSFVQNITIQYLDSPATTSSVTYGIQVTGFGGRTFYINITGTSDGNAGVAAVSSMTLMEIAA